MSNDTNVPEPDKPTSAVEVPGCDGDDRSTKSRRRRRNRRQRNKPVEVKFEGETPEMNKNVFQALTESNDRRQFTRTMEALERYINKKLKYPGDLRSLYQSLELPVLVDPVDISATDAQNPAKLLVWSENKKTYLKRK